MNKAINKKTIIIAVIIAAYAITLPLVLYFTGAFKPTANTPPDLPMGGIYYSPQYIAKTDEEKTELLTELGFDLEAFETAGFSLISEYGVRVYVHEDQPGKLHSIRIDASDNETYYIRMTIYMPGADSMFPFSSGYERREINGKPIGVYESSDLVDRGEIRYHDPQTGCVYIINLTYGLDEPTEAFLNILIK